MQLDDTAHILGNADFFSICNLEQRRMLAFASERRELGAGETLFKSGEIISYAYILISGELISRGQDAPQSDVMHISQPGTVMGELALITKYPRRRTIICETNVAVLAVPRSAFGKLMQQFPDVASRALETVRNDMGKYVSSLKNIDIKP